MVFGAVTGKALSSNACTKICQSVLLESVRNWSEVTTYSWRRVVPTLGHYLKLPDAELMALSDWQDKVVAGRILQVPRMPLRYSSQRYAQSIRTKVKLLCILEKMREDDLSTWDALTASGRRQELLQKSRETSRMAENLAVVLESAKRTHARAFDLARTTALARRRLGKGKEKGASPREEENPGPHLPGARHSPR